MFTLKELFQSSHKQAQQVRENDSTQFPFDPDAFDQEAIIEEVIEQGKSWRVRYQGTWWTARCIHQMSLFPGDTVYVVGRHSITLLIKPNLLDSSAPSVVLSMR
jgi:membrane protein implicated in regulation of membrane protease activity